MQYPSTKPLRNLGDSTRAASLFLGQLKATKGREKLFLGSTLSPLLAFGHYGLHEEASILLHDLNPPSQTLISRLQTSAL